MKKKSQLNCSGVVICDRITMSVKKKYHDRRVPESVIIAVIGFISVIMSFLKMFDFEFNRTVIITAAAVTSAVYIIFSLMRKRTFIFCGISMVFLAAGLRIYYKAVKDGFRYVYNVIYSASYNTDIKYYKFLDPQLEKYCTTIFFVFCIWFLAAIIYTFTIHRPNPFVVIAASFPIIEIGLYNGIDIPVLYGILTVAYYIALLAIATTDMGEYYGGNGGFVRRGDVFFPKRHMNLKVTEKCAIMIIISAVAIAVCSTAVMKISGYSRSDELNRKRTDIKAAVAAFTFDDIASGISGITEAFGFTFNYESHKLGTSDTISYTNQTDLTVTLNKAYEGAVYLKGYAGAIYEGNEWSELDENIYETSDIFDDFSNYGIYPQDFLKIFSNAVYTDSADITLDIDSVRKRNKSYAPYGTGNYGNTDYRYDETVSSKQNGNSCYSYKFTGIDIYNISDFLSARTRNTYSSESITDKQRQEQIKEFCSDNDLFTYQNYFIIDSEISPDIITQQGTYSNGSIIMAALLENKYRDFVYENYMQIPDNENMDEVYTAFEDILSESDSSSTAADKIKILENIRDRIASMTQYTLSPGKTPSNRDFVNYFLFENQKGYCTHYATAGVILARMAGIPARYATGYLIVGDDFNDSARQSDGSYVINLPDSRSHAWAEVYIDGAGWIPFEFTAGYSSMTIDTTVTATTAVEETATETVTTVTEKSSDSQENTSQENTRQTSDENISSSAVSSSIGTTTAVSGKVVPEKHSFTITPVMRNIIISVAILICIILLIYLRRYIIIITGRKRRRTVSAEQAEFIYSYVGKLLAILKIYRGNMTYMEFADYVENTLGGIYFEKGGFKLMMSAILESGFSERQISQETAAEICDFTEQLATSIYGKSSVFVRIYMKFILALI